MKKLLLISASVALLAISCAKEEKESIIEVQDRLLKSYITIVHNDTLTPTAEGYYIIPIEEGTGDYPTSEKWLKWQETVRTLDGTIVSTTIEDTARKAGLFNETLQTMHYTDNYSVLYEGYLYYGLYYQFQKMRKGSKCRVIFPARLVSTSKDPKSTGYTNYIFDVQLDEIIDDPKDYEQKQIEAYRDKYYPGLDSIKNDFYYKRTYTAPDRYLTDSGYVDKDTATVRTGSKVYVTYVGKFVDGFVFDTNIADSAKAHNTYSSSTTYDTLSFTIGQNEVVTGFEEAAKQLQTGDAATVFFTSDWGYGASGYNSSSSSSNSDYISSYYSYYYSDYYSSAYDNTATSTATTVIPQYCPLVFDVKLHRIDNSGAK